MINSRTIIGKLIALIDDNKITELTLSRYNHEPQSSPGHFVLAISLFNLTHDDMELIAAIFHSIKKNKFLKRLNFYHLSFEGKPYAIFAAMLQMLVDNKSMESLRFENTIIGTCSYPGCLHPCQHVDYQQINLSRFLDALAKNTSIRSLKLSDSLLDEFNVDENFYEIASNKYAELLINMKSIENLSLVFTDKRLAFHHIIRMMTNKISVKHLEICGKSDQTLIHLDACVSALTDFLNNTHTIYSISFERCDFNKILNKGLINSFSKALIQHPSIKVINFSGYYVPIEELALALPFNTILEEFNLYDPFLEEATMIKLAKIIQNCPSIKRLTLGNTTTITNFNPVKNQLGFSRLSNAIAKNVSLKVVNLSRNCFNSIALSSLSNALSSRKKNLSLNLSEINGNYSSNDCVYFFQPILSQHCIVEFTYQSKKKSSIKLKCKDIKGIAEAIKINTCLRVLDLRNNKIGNNGAKLIAAAIRWNLLSAIRSVKLDNNSIDHYHIAFVKHAIDEVKKNIALAVKPFDAFASIINDTSRNPYLATELVQHIISFGLFKTLNQFRTSSEIKKLVSCVMTDAQNRGDVYENIPNK